MIRQSGFRLEIPIPTQEILGNKGLYLSFNTHQVPPFSRLLAFPL